MKSYMRVFPAFAALLATSFTPAFGQQSSGKSVEAACPATPAPLPAEFAAWRDRAPIAAATGAEDLGKATLSAGKGANVTLQPTARINWPVRPERPGDEASHGGLLGFTIGQPGTYRVALGAGAWIDVVRDGQVIASTTHAHGAPCTGIRKTVDFPLAPGAYVLEIAGNEKPEIPVLLVRLP